MGYPRHSHHDKIPSWWGNVSNDKGGKMSVTKWKYYWEYVCFKVSFMYLYFSMCICIFARTIVTLCRGMEEPFPYFQQFFYYASAGGLDDSCFLYNCICRCTCTCICICRCTCTCSCICICRLLERSRIRLMMNLFLLSPALSTSFPVECQWQFCICICICICIGICILFVENTTAFAGTWTLIISLR